MSCEAPERSVCTQPSPVVRLGLAVILRDNRTMCRMGGALVVVVLLMVAPAMAQDTDRVELKAVLGTLPGFREIDKTWAA